MNIHKNARLTPLRREEMALAVMKGSLSQAQAALKFAVTAKVVKRWVERYEAEGRAGMADRSSRPRRCPNATGKAVADRIIALRRQRFTAKHIARVVAVSPAAVSRVLARAKLSRLKDLKPAEPVRRYEHDDPGDMIHIDIKNSVASTASDTASPAIAPATPTAAASAGSSSTFASTMPRVSPSRRSCRTRRRRVPLPSSRRRLPTTQALASPPAAS